MNDLAAAVPERSPFVTHDVLNQPPPLEDYDAYEADRPLVEAVRAFGADWASPRLAQTGRRVGSARVQALARAANRYVPELRTHDRFGRRIDVVDFHPAYHELLAMIFGDGTHSFAWTQPRPGAHVARAAMSYLWNQGESGVCCPNGMTFASIAALRHDPDLHNAWAPRINHAGYDPRARYAGDKESVTVGMAMTEKQGGSDLRATTTVARPAGSRRGPGAPYLLTGHKWFFSVPMSDLFLTLARTERGVCSFLATGWMPDGSRSGLRLQRLKDKCGNRSNASSEVEFFDLHAVMLGEEGRGIRTIIEMAHATRLDFAVGSSGLMRQALSQALHHVTHRHAFGAALVEQSAMRNVIADLAIESEAMTWMSLRLAAALDRADRDPAEALLSRIGTPIAKYWACKRAPAFVAEALECHGGNGYVADHLMERLYREAPLNGIWEGTGNVICLDVLRSLARAPDSAGAFLAEVRLARGADARLDARMDALAGRLAHPERLESEARRIVETMALTLQASLLARHAPGAVWDAFRSSRLGGEGLVAYGTLAPGIDTARIVERARVAP